MSSEAAAGTPMNVVEPPAQFPDDARGAGSASASRPQTSAGRQPAQRIASPLSTLSAHGAPLVWLTGGALATALVMIVGLLLLILYHGLQTFWPLPLRQFQALADTAGESVTKTTFLGEVARSQWYRPERSQIDPLQQRSPALYAKAQMEMKAHDGQLRRQ